MIDDVNDELTREWLEVFNEHKAYGGDPANSIFFRMALHTLPLGVDPENEDVKKAIEEIRESVARRSS